MMNDADGLIMLAYATTLLLLAWWIVYAWWQHRRAKQRLQRVQSMQEGQ